MNDFSGKWQTSFGPMDLAQEGARVHGSYVYRGSECPVEGKVSEGRLTFTYQEAAVHGEGWFELARRGNAFSGQYRPDGQEQWQRWEGERIGFDGLWNTSFGLMRLVQEGDQVIGFYEAGGAAEIDGQREDSRLVFDYREPRVRGRGRFELAADGLSFQGEWNPRGGSAWMPWQGIRVRPQPDLTWLVVIEAPWQRFLADQEYSFGNMLREFFARLTHVQVRHRFFTNEAGLRRCCRDLFYIAEPVVLVLATHAHPDGIHVDGQTIAVPALADALRHAETLQLVHFSACLLMQGPPGLADLGVWSSRARLPISGYRTSVDWAASAIIEFTFLDLVLSRRLSPAAAAEQLVKLLPFAGDEGVPDGAFPAAGFKIVMPAPVPVKSGSAAGRRRASR